MTDNTTPRPWHQKTDGSSSLDWIEGRDGALVAMQVAPKDAALVVRACNSYDELVAALDTLLSATGAPVQDTDRPARSYLESARRQAHAALAKARE